MITLHLTAPRHRSDIDIDDADSVSAAGATRM
jgi:hypothetical protein